MSPNSVSQKTLWIIVIGDPLELVSEATLRLSIEDNQVIHENSTLMNKIFLLN